MGNVYSKYVQRDFFRRIKGRLPGKDPKQLVGTDQLNLPSQGMIAIWEWQ